MTIAVAVRMGRKIQQNVFANERRQVHPFRPGEFPVHCESRHFDDVGKLLETRDALQLDWLPQASVYPKRVCRNADVEFIFQRAGAANIFGFQFGDRTVLYALQVEALSRNLFKVNFHW